MANNTFLEVINVDKTFDVVHIIFKSQKLVCIIIFNLMSSPLVAKSRVLGGKQISIYKNKNFIWLQHILYATFKTVTCGLA